MTTYVITPSDSIVAKLATMSPADSLLLRGGTYTEGDLNPPSGASDSARTIIAPYQNEPVIIRPNGGYNRAFTVSARQYIAISGFTLDAVNCNFDCVKMEESGLVYSHHIRVADCEIKNAKNNGVLMAGDPSGGSGGTPGGFNELLRCYIHANATFNFSPFGHGIYVTSPNNLIEGCRIEDHNSDTAHNSLAIHVYNSGQGGLHNQIIRRNLIKNQTRGGGILVADGSNSRIDSNIVWGNWYGIVLFGGSSGVLSANNTVYANTNGGMDVKGTSGARIVNSILWQNGTDLLNESGSYTEDHNLIGIDPLFNDAPNGDFSLRAGSPAINAGADLSAYFTTDFYGRTRG